MSSAGTYLTNPRGESDLLSNEPPSFFSPSSATSVLNDPVVPAAGQALSDSPPAYDSLTDIPIWSVPVSQLNASPNIQLWNIPLPNQEHWVDPFDPYRSFTTVPPQTAPDSFFKGKFIRTKPLNLGIFVLLLAFAEAAVGTVLASKQRGEDSESLLYGIPFWTPVCYISTGCMLISAHLIPSSCRVKTSLLLNLCSIVSGCVALAFNSRDIQRCKTNPFTWQCFNKNADLDTYYYIIVSINVIILCVCIASASICVNVLCCLPQESPPPQPVVIENYFTSPPPIYPDAPQYSPPPAYTAFAMFKEDDDVEETI